MLLLCLCSYFSLGAHTRNRTQVISLQESYNATILYELYSKALIGIVIGHIKAFAPQLDSHLSYDVCSSVGWGQRDIIVMTNPKNQIITNTIKVSLNIYTFKNGGKQSIRNSVSYPPTEYISSVSPYLRDLLSKALILFSNENKRI